RGGVDVFNPNAIRASTGAVFELPVVVCGEEEAVERLTGAEGRRAKDEGRSGWRVIAAMVDGAVDYREVARGLRDGGGDERGVAVVIGPEDRGLGARWAEVAEATGGAAVRVPMAAGGVVDSLNASVAAGVLVYGLGLGVGRSEV
ncbi:MAG: TrmH family RNA methyltransferase, partial [Planctomycetota bacterium]